MELQKFMESNMDIKVIIFKLGFYTYDWIELTEDIVSDIHR